MKKLFFYILFLALSAVFCQPVVAQLTNQGYFRHITVKEGLNNGVVYDLLQDKDGYLWFATKDGLNKYDGINLLRYSVNEEASLFARDNIVLSMEYANDSMLLCGTGAGGIYYYDHRLDKFEALQLEGENPIISSVYHLQEINDSIVLASSASGLFQINLKHGSIDYIDRFTEISHLTYKDSDGFYWIGTMNGLYKASLYPENGLLLGEIKEVSGFEDYAIFSISEDSKGNICVGTRESELLILDKDNLKVHKSIGDLGMINSPVRSIVSYAGNHYIALDGQGIAVFDEDWKLQQSFKHFDDVSNSLSNNGAYDIMFDADASMWVATYGGGVNLYQVENNGFISVSHQKFNKNSLRNNTARSFIDVNGDYWFGTKRGVSILNPKRNRWKHRSLDLGDGQDQIVLSMTKSGNQVYIGTFGSGLIKMNAKSLEYSRISRVDENGNDVGTDFIYASLVDKEGRIWNGGIHGNLSVFNPKTNLTTAIPISNVKALYESSWGKLYVGTTNGLLIVDMEGYEVSRPDPGQISLNKNRIFSVFGEITDREKILWLGTEGGGLIKWDIENAEVISFTVEDGMPSNFVYGIQSDSDGSLWLSTTNGLTRFDPLKKEMMNYSFSDGLSDQEFNFGASGKTGRGEIVFGGQNGFTIISPEQISTSELLPHVVFNSFKLFGQEQEIAGDDSPINSHINSIDKLTLKHNQNSISFGFSAINYTSPEKIKYSWVLEGFESQWSEPGFSREAIYTNIRHGKYVFRVKASNQDGIWGANERSVEIRIKPPFWRSVWAYALYFIILVAIFLMALQYNRIRINEKHAKEKTRFFVNIAHDLRTPLTLIKAPLEELSNKGVSGKIDMGSLLLARKNVDRLNRLVSQLMDFQKADLDKLQFRPAPYKFNEFFKETSFSFLPLINQKKIKIDFDLPDDEFELWFDRDKMEKIIFNLISNAVKYTKSGGLIQLSVTKDKRNCEIEIKDNGIGIPENQKKEIFTRYFRASNVANSQETGSGVGLILVKKLVEIHKGKIWFESEEGIGTTFRISIPFKEYDLKEHKAEHHRRDEIVPIYKKEYAVFSDSGEEGEKKFGVLLVEDNLELLDYAAGILSKFYEVHTAENGKEGLDQLAKVNPDIVISDIMMPEMDGNKMCSIIKNNVETCHVPVILLTALNTLEYKIEGLKVGADAYIEKPYDVSYLIAQINNLLQGRQRLKERFAIQAPSDELAATLNSIDSELLEKAGEFVVQNLSNHELSVEMLAAELCMSRPVLYRKLKALTDQSPQDFIRLIRINEAKKLLLQSKQSIAEVAYETGFNDPKYFSTSFKRVFDKTPTQFLQESRKASKNQD